MLVDPDRRRRADLAAWRTVATRDQAGHRADRRAGRALSRRCTTAQGQDHAVRRRHAGRRHRGQGAGRIHLAGASPSWSTTSCWSSEPAARKARSRCCCRSKRPWSKAPARPALPRCWRNPERFAGKKVGLVLCGGNIDTRLLANVLLRDLARSGRLARLRVTLQDRPGALFKVMRDIRRAQCQHHRDLPPADLHHLPAKGLVTDIECEARDREQLDALVAALRAEGYTVEPGRTELTAISGQRRSSDLCKITSR